MEGEDLYGENNRNIYSFGCFSFDCLPDCA